MEQTAKYNELGEKPVGKLLMQYSIPAITAMAASSVYHIIDGIFIGQGVGPEAIMGLALTGPVMSLTSAFGAIVGVGASTLMSVRLGQRDYNTAQRILGNVVVMNVLMGLVLGGILLFFLEPIMRFFGASDATLPYACQFMSVILAGNVVTHLYLGLNSLLRSTNRPKQAMQATIGTVILNCAFAPLFIFVLNLGIRGAALATVLAQCCMLLWQLRLFSRKDDLVHLSRTTLRLERRIVSESLIIGLPSFFMNLCACLVAAIFTRSMTEYGGDVAVGSYGITHRLVMLIVLIVIGLNQGMQPIAGFNFGAQKFDRLISVLKLTIIFATVITTTGFLGCTFFAEECATLFAKSSPELIAEASRGLRIAVMVFPFVGMQMVSTTFFQSIGYAGKSIFLSLTRQLIFLIPSVLILPHFFDDPVMGVWYSMPLSDAAAAILSGVLLSVEIRKFKQGNPATGAALRQ